ncbi:hypothetical protein J6590_003353 [Homalodisca vitripennis]|nr:hypothetical protein J6590_003353 [Homalodisca vitripennis]
MVPEERAKIVTPTEYAITQGDISKRIRNSASSDPIWDFSIPDIRIPRAGVPSRTLEYRELGTLEYRELGSHLGLYNSATWGSIWDFLAFQLEGVTATPIECQTIIGFGYFLRSTLSDCADAAPAPLTHAAARSSNVLNFLAVRAPAILFLTREGVSVISEDIHRLVKVFRHHFAMIARCRANGPASAPVFCLPLLSHGNCYCFKPELRQLRPWSGLCLIGKYRLTQCKFARLWSVPRRGLLTSPLYLTQPCLQAGVPALDSSANGSRVVMAWRDHATRSRTGRQTLPASEIRS